MGHGIDTKKVLHFHGQTFRGTEEGESYLKFREASYNTITIPRSEGGDDRKAKMPVQITSVVVGSTNLHF